MMKLLKKYKSYNKQIMKLNSIKIYLRKEIFKMMNKIIK